MRDLGEIDFQLHRLGLKNRFWGRAEVRELSNILANDEIITAAVNGRHEGGFALLVTTDRRLLLVDKKVWFMSLEDVRFDMISEIDYSARLIDATVSIMTINKVLRFTTMRQQMLRDLTTYLQQRVMELRQHIIEQERAAMQQIGHPIATNAPVQQNAVSDSFSGAQQNSNMAQMVDSSGQPIHNIKQLSSKMGAYPTASFTMQRKFGK